MGLLLDSLLYEFVTVFVLLSGALAWYYNHAFKYWQRVGIATISPSFPAGNIGSFIMQREHIGDVVQRIYDRYKGEGPFSGIYLFNAPGLIVNDPEQIKNILVRDFQHFHDHGMYYNEKTDPLSANLFTYEGHKWKAMREKLTPTFTSGKMKLMLPMILGCANQLKEYLEEHVDEHNDLEIKDVLARFNTDVIGTCAFGIDCNSLKDPNALFRKNGQKVFALSFIQKIKMIISSNKLIARALGLTVFDSSACKFMIGVVKETVEFREKNNVTRNDFMQLLIQLKNKGYLESDILNEGKLREASSKMAVSKLTMTEVAAQAFLFYLAGFETSSSAISFCLYELAINKDVQEKVRDEIRRVLNKFDGQITYESLLQMRYLDQTIYETLRKYPVLAILSRECTKEYELPGTNIQIPKGMPMFVPVKGIHHDPEYYPDPQRFNPDRFTEENQASRPKFTYLPFGEGPRICIGMRFGMLQTRVGLITVLMYYSLEISKKTPVPLNIEPVGFFTASVGGIYLKLRPLNE